MPEAKMSRQEAGRRGGEASAGKERHFTPESRARLVAGARRGGQAAKTPATKRVSN